MTKMGATNSLVKVKKALELIEYIISLHQADIDNIKMGIVVRMNKMKHVRVKIREYKRVIKMLEDEEKCLSLLQQ